MNSHEFRYVFDSPAWHSTGRHRREQVNRQFGLRFIRIVDPQQLEVRIGEKEPAALGSLSRMDIGVSLVQTTCSDRIGSASANCSADENVVQFNGHGLRNPSAWAGFIAA
jgi:hypothetical protein